MKVSTFAAALAYSALPSLAKAKTSLRGQDRDGQRDQGALALPAAAAPAAPDARALQEALLPGEYQGKCTSADPGGYDIINFIGWPALFPPLDPLYRNHEGCLSSCPASGHFVGYEYTTSHWDSYLDGREGSWPFSICFCRYRQGYVQTIEEPGEERNGFRCPDDASSLWGGPPCYAGSRADGGQVVGGNGDPRFICRTRFADDAALQQAQDNAITMAAETFADWIAENAGANPHLVRYAVSFRTSFDCFLLRPDGIPDDISSWDVSNSLSFCAMFRDALEFNQPIGNWDVGNGLYFSEMFRNALEFNQPIGNWNVGNGHFFAHMFRNARAFNQPIGDWDVGSGGEFHSMFRNARAFNQPIGDWDVGIGWYFGFMFSDAHAFNQPIGNWNVGNGQYFADMFRNARAFNQPIGDWDVGRGEDFDGMFQDARAFDQPIGDWDVGNGRVFQNMFQGARAFDQDLSSWRISVEDEDDVEDMFHLSGMTNLNHCPCIRLSHLDWQRRCPGKQDLQTPLAEEDPEEPSPRYTRAPILSC